MYVHYIYTTQSQGLSLFEHFCPHSGILHLTLLDQISLSISSEPSLEFLPESRTTEPLLHLVFLECSHSIKIGHKIYLLIFMSFVFIMKENTFYMFYL